MSQTKRKSSKLVAISLTLHSVAGFLKAEDVDSKSHIVRTIAMEVDVWNLKIEMPNWPGTAITPTLDNDDIAILMECIYDRSPAPWAPKSTGSSYIHNKATIGMVALWLIEGIRTKREKPFCFHSGNVLCLKEGGPYPNSWDEKSLEENQDSVAKAYEEWWGKYMTTKDKEDFNINPLRGTGLAWR